MSRSRRSRACCRRRAVPWCRVVGSFVRSGAAHLLSCLPAACLPPPPAATTTTTTTTPFGSFCRPFYARSTYRLPQTTRARARTRLPAPHYLRSTHTAHYRRRQFHTYHRPHAPAATYTHLPRVHAPAATTFPGSARARAPRRLPVRSCRRLPRAAPPHHLHPPPFRCRSFVAAGWFGVPDHSAYL